MTAATHPLGTAAEILRLVEAMEARCEEIRRLLAGQPDPDHHMGYMDEVRPGDRVQVDQQWRTVARVHETPGADGEPYDVTLVFADGSDPMACPGHYGIRIAERPVPDPEPYRLVPSTGPVQAGSVA